MQVLLVPGLGGIWIMTTMTMILADAVQKSFEGPFLAHTQRGNALDFHAGLYTLKVSSQTGLLDK